MAMDIDLFNYQSKYGPNTNFRFPTDKATKYLKTSEGKVLPYKLFSGRNDAYPNSAILREKDNQGYAIDFALVERQFSENKSLSFRAGTKVSDVNDVAWLFRALEDEAVEHTFALYKFKDNSYLVQHLSTGGITSTVVDLRLLTGNVFKMQPESITLVHNHPSGQLISSKHDRLMLQRLHEIFDDTGIKVEDGIVINLRSGKYLVFNGELGSDRILELSEQNQLQGKVSTFSFNKQIFAANYQPLKISSPEDTAAYISSQKFGLSDKTEAIILNNANDIVGKFILPQHRQFEKLTELMTIHAGTGVILYGNNVNEQMYKDYREKLELMGFTALDAILLESGNFHSLYERTKINVYDHLVDKFSKSNLNAEPIVGELGNRYGKNEKISVEIGVYANDEAKSVVPKPFDFDSTEELKAYLDLTMSQYDTDPILLVRIAEGKQPFLLDRLSQYALNELMNEVEKHFSSKNVVENTKNREEKFLQHIPEERQGEAFHIKVNRSEAEYLLANDILEDIMCKEYGDDDDWIGVTKDDMDEEIGGFDEESQTFEIDISHNPTEDFVKEILEELELFNGIFHQKEIPKDVQSHYELTFFDKYITPKTKAYKDFISEMETTSPEIFFKNGEREFSEKEKKWMQIYDFRNGLNPAPKSASLQQITNQDNQNNFINNPKTSIMSTQEFDTAQYLKDQMKYLGFGEGEKLHKDLENAINGEERQFEIKTTSDKTLPENKVDFTLKFNKSEKGGIFLNAYQAELTNDKGEKFTHNFGVGKENSFTAKEAVNLLEGRAVKTELKNTKTDEMIPAFVKLKFNEAKNDYGNYKLEIYNENYGVDTGKIVDKAGLIFDKPEYRDNVIKSLEKGNIVKVKFSLDNQTVEGKAVLNPQYKNLNLYDNEMNRINTNKPLKGLEVESPEKNQVKQQSISRGI